MLRSSLCNYSNAYTLVKGSITAAGPEAAAIARQADRNDKQIMFKNCPTFTDCIGGINSK